MKYLPHIIKAEHAGGHSIVVQFDDGLEKTVDFKDWLKGPVFKPLKSTTYFKKFFLDGGGIAWPNGVDIAPEAIYEAQDIDDRYNNSDERTHARKPRTSRSR